MGDVFSRPCPIPTEYNNGQVYQVGTAAVLVCIWSLVVVVSSPNRCVNVGVALIFYYYFIF